MRKLKKYKEISTFDNYTIIYERIENTVNGNPRYEVSIFDSGHHKGTYNIVSYNIEESIKNLIELL